MKNLSALDICALSIKASGHEVFTALKVVAFDSDEGVLLGQIAHFYLIYTHHIYYTLPIKLHIYRGT